MLFVATLIYFDEIASKWDECNIGGAFLIYTEKENCLKMFSFSVPKGNVQNHTELL